MKTTQEDEFLKNDDNNKKVAVTIFLMSGIKLQGIIEGIDDKTIILRRQGHRQLVYKHAIATMMLSTAGEI